MIGELAVSFCDRKAGQGSVCLDLWSYPDGSYNLVMVNYGGRGQREHAFPCAFQQLAGPLEHKSLFSQNDEGVLVIERCGETVCAEFRPYGGRDGFRHCLGLDVYRQAIQALEANAVGYLA